MTWPKLHWAGDSGSEASARQALLDLGAPEDSLELLATIMQRHNADHPAVYPLVVECGTWLEDNECGAAGQPACALLVFVPTNENSAPSSSYQGKPDWQLTPFVYKIYAGGRLHDKQWTNGTSFERETTCQKWQKYQASCRILGGGHAGRPVQTWRIDTFDDGLRLQRSKQNARRKPRGGNSQGSDKQWMLDALKQRSMADLVAALRATDPDGSITHIVLQCLLVSRWG